MVVDKGGDCTFRDLVNRLAEQRKEARKHQHYPLTDIVRDARRSGLDVPEGVFNVELVEAPLMIPLLLEEVSATFRGVSSKRIAHELSLLYDPTGEEGIRFRFEYRKKKLTQETVHRLCDRFRRACIDLIAHPDTTLSDYSVLSPEERDQILVQFNQTDQPLGEPQTLVQSFEAQSPNPT